MEVAPNVHQIQVPVPFPLKFVNCYLAPGDDGWHMLDTGMAYAPALITWNEAFAGLGIGVRDIRRIYISHMHADHIGLAHRFQAASGAEVYLLDREWAMLYQWWNPDWLPPAIANLFRSHGMPEAAVAPVLAALLEVMEALGSCPDEVKLLQDGDMVPFGPLSCRVIWTPGHSDGHASLLNESGGVLLAGDHVLPRITPNISLWPGGRPNPLADYLHALRQVMDLPVRLVLPGHGPAFGDLRGRVSELQQHHGQRLQQMRRAVGQGSTAYQVTRSVFRSDLTAHELRFAMSETLAHLEYMVGTGTLSRAQDAGINCYLPA